MPKYLVPSSTYKHGRWTTVFGKSNLISPITSRIEKTFKIGKRYWFMPQSRKLQQMRQSEIHQTGKCCKRPFKASGLQQNTKRATIHKCNKKSGHPKKNASISLSKSRFMSSQKNKANLKYSWHDLPHSKVSVNGSTITNETKITKEYGWMIYENIYIFYTKTQVDLILFISIYL